MGRPTAITYMPLVSASKMLRQILYPPSLLFYLSVKMRRVVLKKRTNMINNIAILMPDVWPFLTTNTLQIHEKPSSEAGRSYTSSELSAKRYPRAPQELTNHSNCANALSFAPTRAHVRKFEFRHHLRAPWPILAPTQHWLCSSRCCLIPGRKREGERRTAGSRGNGA